MFARVCNNLSHDIGSSVCARHLTHVSCSSVFDLSSTLSSHSSFVSPIFNFIFLIFHFLFHVGVARARFCALRRMRSLGLWPTTPLSQITKWESMCSRSLTQSARAPRSLDAVRVGVAHVRVWVERKSERNLPSFHTSSQAYVCDWSYRAGWPRLVRYDRGMHDRGVFSSILIENGVMIRLVGLEIPEQISRAGRRGDIPKKTLTKSIKDTHVSGRELKETILGECLPSYRAKACKSFFRWDRDERVRRAASGKAALVIGSQQVGDKVLYCREPRAGKHEFRRNVRSRLTGFEKHKNSLSEAQLQDSIFARFFH